MIGMSLRIRFHLYQIWVLSFFIGGIPLLGSNIVGIDESTVDTPTDSIFSRYKQELEQAQKNGVSYQIAQKHLQLGEYYVESGVLSEAIDQFTRGLEVLDQNDTLQVILNNDIGQIHLTLEQFDRAKQYFEDAMKTSEALSYTKGLALSRGFLGSCYEKKGDYLEALKHQRASLLIFETLGDSLGIATVNENIGSIYEDLLQYNLAYEFFEKAYKYLDHSDSQLKANILNNLGDVFRKRGVVEESVKYTRMALEVSQRINNNDELESAHKDLSEAYALSGDYQRAYQHLLDAELYNELLLKEQNTRQINKLQTIYDSNKKEAQIKLLQEQNKVSTANQRLLLLTGLAIAIILGILYYYDRRRRRAQNRIQAYQQRTLQAELEKKQIEEDNLHQEIQLKTSSLSKYSLHLSQKNKILLDLSNKLKNIANRKDINHPKKIKELARDIDFNLQQENEWDEFATLFNEVHPEFVKKLSGLTEESLSPAELRLSILLRLNLSSKEIASILRITPDSVRVARYRLRKKLPIEQKDELVNFLIEL